MTDQPEQAQPSGAQIATDGAMTTNPALAAALDPEAAAALQAAKDNPVIGAGGAAQTETNKDGGGANNENSVMSFWSSSNSDSDEFNDANKADAADQTTTRRGKKGQGRSRRRRSPGSDNPLKPRLVDSEDHQRKEYEGGKGTRRRSRSRDNSPNNANAGQAASGNVMGSAGGAHGTDADGEGHHRRDRSQNGGSNYSRGSSQDRGGTGRYDSRRRGMKDRNASGANMSSSGNPRGPGGSNYRRGGAGGKRDGGDYNQKGFFIPSMSKPLVSFQQFSSLQTRQTDLYTIKFQYRSYTTEHKDKHASAFWKDHEKEPWFMEQYNPMTIFQVRQEQQGLIQTKAQSFFKRMPFDMLDLTKRNDDPPIGPQLHKFDPNSRTLYLKQIPTYITKLQLKQAVQSIASGFEQIIFSRPLQMHNYERFAWLVFQSEDATEQAIPAVETLVIRAPTDSTANETDFKLSPIKNNQTVKPPKVTPQMPLDHLSRDIELAKRLIKDVFDVEKQIEFPFERLDTEIEGEDAKFDTLLLYLRQVHGYCFFSGVKAEDERTLAAKCGSQHLRLPPSVERIIFDSSALYSTARQFEQNYIQAAEKILEKGPDEKLSDPQEDELLVEMKNQYCTDKTREVVPDKKYVCKVCEKAFRSTEFVVKHIKNKHEDRLVRYNYSYFKQQARENFLKELEKKQEANPVPQPNTGNSFASGAGQSGHGGPGLNRENSDSFFHGSGYQGSGGDRGGRGGYGGGRGGHDFRGGRGRGGHHGDGGDFRGGDRYGNPRMMHRQSTGYMGGASAMSGGMDGLGGDGNPGGMDMDGDKRNKAGAAAQREYIDYDDPTQFDSQGQRLNQDSKMHLQQQQQQIQQQQLLLKQQGGGGSAAAQQQEKDRQIVSYDDLF